VSRFIADENFDNDVIHGLLRRKDEILLLAEGSREGEWEGQVVYLPL
jgi:hypothetical protein